MTMKAWWIVPAAILSLGLCLPMFMRCKAKKLSVQSQCWKAMGTLCALALALGGAIPLGGNRWLGAGALLLCTIADVMLERKFYVGMGFFMGGHLCYIAWFLHRQQLGSLQAVVFGVLLAAAVCLILRLRPLLKEKLVPYAAYAMVLITMCACGVGCATGGAAGIFTAVGVVLFVISDMMVCWETLRSTSTAFDWTAMVLYYTAQLCLGTGVLLAV